MKKAVSLFLCIVLFGVFLAGCGKNESAVSQIVIARNLDITDLDPTSTNDNTSIWTLSLLLEGLVKASDDGKKIEPSLAKSWEISSDGLTYTFHLIPNLKFSDGTPVKGEDWVFSFERAKNTAEKYWKFAAENITEVTAPDDQTLVVKIKEPNASTLSYFSMFNMTVQSKAAYEKAGSYAEKGPIGTGPYYVKEWVKDNYLLLEKNPYYHAQGEPKTAQIKFVVVPDDNARVMQLQSGAVDIITDVPYSSMATLKNANDIQTMGIPSTSDRYLVFNTTDPILGNAKVRQALLYATNKQDIVNMVLNGYGEAAISYMPKNGLFWNDQIQPAPYDVEKAKALLKDAGYPNGFEVEILVRSGNAVFEQIATIIKEQWAKAGVKVNLVSLDTASLLERQNNMKHQIVIGSWTDDLLDPSQLGSYFWDYKVSKSFYTGYQNQTASAIFKQACIELDDNKRADMYKTLQKILYDDSPVINLYHSEFPVALKKNIQGFVQTPLGAYRFDNLVKTK
ncbi:MAG: putative transporter component [Firmicutes bacterium]|nr:putative transporter component [Bacillota bacterium]